MRQADIVFALGLLVGVSLALFASPGIHALLRRWDYRAVR